MREAIVDTDELETGVLLIHDVDGIDLEDDDHAAELEDDDDDKSPVASLKADIDPDAKVNDVANVVAPDTFSVPVVCMFSARVICVESSELIVVPTNFIAPSLMLPVPFGVIVTSPLATPVVMA